MHTSQTARLWGGEGRDGGQTSSVSPRDAKISERIRRGEMLRL